MAVLMRPRERSHKDGFETVTRTVRGRRMRAWVAGSGRPIVFVHGLGVTSRYLLPTAQHLTRHGRTLLPDLPGFGQSDPAPDVLDIPGLADALASWIAAIDGAPAVLVANSVGCQVAAHLAVERPQLVGAAVLAGPTVDPHARSPWQQAVRWIRGSTREPPSLAMVVLRDYLDTTPWRLAVTIRHMFADRIERKLPLLRAPTIVVRGGRDPIVSQRWAEEAAQLLPDGRLAVIPGAGHTVNYSAPLELARITRSLL